MPNGIFRIPTCLRNNLPSFEYSRKIALTTSLRKVRKGRDSSPLIQCNTHAPCRTTSTIKKNGYRHHFFIQIPIGHVLIHSFDKIHVLVVTVELIWLLLLNILSLLFSNVKKLSVRLARFRGSYRKHPAVVLTSQTSYTAFLLDVCCAVQSCHVSFFAAVCHR